MYPADEVCTKWNFIDSCQMAWLKLRIKLASKQGENVLYSSLKARPNVIEQFEKIGCRIVTLENPVDEWTWISW